MLTLRRKLNQLFRENVQLREDCLRLRLTWTEEKGKGEMQKLLSMTLADILNPREGSSIRRINGLIRLKEKRSVCLEN